MEQRTILLLQALKELRQEMTSMNQEIRGEMTSMN